MFRPKHPRVVGDEVALYAPTWAIALEGIPENNGLDLLLVLL
jgi:hypothetical protein